MDSMMNDNNDGAMSIPILQRPVSLLEHGPNSHNLAAAAQERHPVDYLQQQQQAATSSVDLDMARHVFGSGLAMRLATEQKIAAQQDAALPIRHATSSSLYREIVSGTDVANLEFSDILNLPEHQPDVPRENLHLAAERKLGMW